MVRRFTISFVFFVAGFAGAQLVASAQTPGGASSAPADYGTFTKGLTPQRGLFTIWRKDGKVYIELAKAQLDTDFIQTIVPSSGLGGFSITPGLPYLQFPSARIVRFTRNDNTVSVTWPNTSFIATQGTPAASAVEQSFAPSVIANAPIAAADSGSGTVVIDASYLLKDNLDLTDALRQALNTDKKPGSGYTLDDARSYFGYTKAFPENVIVQVRQTYASGNPPDVLDNVIDARAIGIDVKYNLVQAPALGTYMPRLADDRVGYYPNIQLQFDNDKVRERQVRTIARWNIARHPMVYYISNTVPVQYRETIREALLTWNNAFAKIGYPNAVIVKEQPSDPNWYPDDVRYNTVHWLTLAYGGGYAQAGFVWDPRTGEMIHTSIVIDSDLMQFGYIEGSDVTAPTRESAPAGFAAHEAAYARSAKASAMFGLVALQALGDVPMGQLPPHYALDFLKSIVLHESGHNWGLQHNFIASEAYTAADIRSASFTARYGLVNSVMEYTPTNIWPKGMSTGTYFQTILGPYDYYAIKWGYEPIPGARTPEQERPTLLRWASKWSDPRYRFAMDEDVDWGSGHAIDPRIDQDDLTNDNLSWCESQMRLSSALIGSIPSRFAQYGESHDPMRQAFAYAMYPARICTRVAWHYVGGEELSRAHIGDPNAQPPLVPVSRNQSKRAFDFLDEHLFSASAWNHVSPNLLRQMVYSEWVTDLPQPAWAYDPPVRHDVPLSTIVQTMQQETLLSMFDPVLLQRLDDLSLKYAPGSSMSLADDFAWTQTAIFGDLRSNEVAAMGEIHRNLQQWYARMLAQMLVAAKAGTPYDAQSLARAELVAIVGDVKAARAKPRLDDLTRAHLDALEAVAQQALSARMVAPPPLPADGS